VVSWRVFDEAEPEFAARVRTLFEAGRHKTIATLRFGSMARSRKGADLGRDPRFALHGPTVHPEPGREGEWPGEAKIAGRAVGIGPVDPDGTSTGDGEDGPGELFRADISEVVLTALDDTATRLVVEWWTPGGGRRRVERD